MQRPKAAPEEKQSTPGDTLSALARKAAFARMLEPPCRWDEKASLPGVPLGPQYKDGLEAQFRRRLA